MKQKILYILTKSDVGGAQKYVADIAKCLDKNTFEVKILYGGTDIRWLSNRVWWWAFFLNDWLATFELVKIFRRERPDIIHLNNSKAGVIGSLAAGLYKLSLNLPPPTSYLPPPKVVFTAHGWVFNPENYLKFPVRQVYIWLHKISAFFQDAIINVSEHDHKLALRYKIAPQAKLTTIHNGIDPNISFLDKESARKAISAQCDMRHGTWDMDRQWIGSIGRLTKEKDYATLIEAAALLPNAYFFIIGDGLEKTNLQLITHNLKLTDRVFFIPPTGEDAKYLKAFDIFAMSSIKEGFPYVLLEAMAAGLPIAATEAGGIGEAIAHDKNGLLAPIRNPQSLALAIKELIQDRAKASRLGLEAKRALERSFTLETTTPKTEKIYIV